jgi:hypothetical protein
MVLNDVGPVIAMDALQRIGEYLGKAPDFADLAEAEAYVRVVCAPFGKPHRRAVAVHDRRRHASEG